MVHHYLEEESDKGGPSEGVKFNCVVEKPFGDAPAAAPAEEEPMIELPPAAPPPCCPIPTVSSDLLEALPTVLVAIGVAYVIGVASGAFIFSSTD